MLKALRRHKCHNFVYGERRRNSRDENGRYRQGNRVGKGKNIHIHVQCNKSKMPEGGLKGKFDRYRALSFLARPRKSHRRGRVSATTVSWRTLRELLTIHARTMLYIINKTLAFITTQV